MQLRKNQESCGLEHCPQPNRRHVRGDWKRYLGGAVFVCLLLLSFGSVRMNAQNMNCTIILPKDPLTAKGLSTPFQLTATVATDGPCNETNPNQSAFVQAAIIDEETGKVSLYEPLVIDQGTQPAIAPTVPTIPSHAVVAIWFGFNGNNLTQASADSAQNLQEARCVNGGGANAGIFGQVSYCNAHEFFRAVRRDIDRGQLVAPALGVSPKDNLPCPTTRSFRVVDQDPSDNLPVFYLISAKGLLAQYNAANQAALPGSTVLVNPSDEYVGPVVMNNAIGCSTWMIPDQTLGKPGPSLAFNELLAHTAQATPVALVPAGDPMTQDNGNSDLAKVDLYRIGVDQPVADSYHDVDTARYCRQLLRIAPQSLLTDQAFFAAAPPPVAGAATNLFTFLGNRFVATYQILNCQGLLNIENPVSVTMNAQMMPNSVTVNTIALGTIIQDLASQKAADDEADSKERADRTHE